MRGGTLPDPRLEAMFGPTSPPPHDIRPAVTLPRRGLSNRGWLLIAAAVAILLFVVLEARRTARMAQAPAPARGSEAPFADPPALYLPPPLEAPDLAPKTAAPLPYAPPVPVVAPGPTIIRSPSPVTISAPPPAAWPGSAPAAVSPPPPRVSQGSALVVDAPPQNPDNVSTPASGAGALGGLSRARAGSLANRSYTVPQGHVIPAVLETGFDSTNPGFARAIVSRDVRGFDSRFVLIPRGSRLIGEFKAEPTPGESRAVISWTRLIRPNGTTIALDSPLVDPEGRTGIKANVNTHFMARLGDSLLQSTVELARVFAGRKIAQPVVIVPGQGAVGSTMGGGRNYTPTLTVAPGKTINVFVARDLDFSPPGSGR